METNNINPSNNQFSTNLSQESPVNGQEEYFHVKELLYLCLSHWKWFAVSLTLAFIIFTVYLLRTLPVYTRTATLLIKEDSKSKGMSNDISSAFSDMALFQSNSNVIDELKSLQSPAVMMEVVKRLGLDREYYIDGAFHSTPIYGESLPITVTFENVPDNETVFADIQLRGDGSYKISKFIRDGEEISGEYIGHINTRIKTPVGIMAVYPTAYYSHDYENIIHVNRHSLYSATNHYLSKLEAALSDKNGATVDLTYKDVNTQRAEDILNMVITVYNERWVKDKNQIAISTSMFINERLGVIEKELGNVDEDISSYKSEHLLPDVEMASSMYMSQANKASTDIMSLQNQAYMAKYIRKYLGTEANKYQLLPANSGLENTSVESQITEYNKAMLERNSLVANSSESNPIVSDLDAGLATMRSAIIKSIDNISVTLNNQIKSLQRYGGEATSQIASNPKQAKYLLSVERQQKVKESLYLFLLQKREENELSQAFTAYNTRIITPPYGSSSPTSPVRQNVYLLALALGLIVPIVIIFIRENMNTTVRGRKDLESSIISVPFLGEIPLSGSKSKKWWQFWKNEEDKKAKLVVKQGSRNMMNEAFRVLRTNLEFMTAEQKTCQVISTTSFNPGSGKTFITMNLATSLAIKKRKILVIDCDLRRGSLSEYFATPKNGLSEYLAGKTVDYKDIITSSKMYETLDMIGYGSVPPNPTELLSNPRFAELIQQVRTEYEFVFIDCPPIDIVADTSIIEKQADRTLFVVRAGLLERSMIPEIDKDYKSNRFKNMALVLNGTPDGGNSRYGYHYSYGYHYGYHSYGYYGSKDK